LARTIPDYFSVSQPGQSYAQRFGLDVSPGKRKTSAALAKDKQRWKEIDAESAPAGRADRRRSRGKDGGRRLPRRSGSADCQFEGKGKWLPVTLQLRDGALSFVEGADRVVRKCDVYGCKVAPPQKKQQRHALRLELAQPDSAGASAYVISLATD